MRGGHDLDVDLLAHRELVVEVVVVQLAGEAELAVVHHADIERTVGGVGLEEDVAGAGRARQLDVEGQAGAGSDLVERALHVGGAAGEVELAVLDRGVLAGLEVATVLARVGKAVVEAVLGVEITDLGSLGVRVHARGVAGLLDDVVQVLMTRIALAFFLAGGRPVVLGVDGQRVEEAHVLVSLGQTAGIRVDVVVPDSKAGAQDPRIAGRQHRVAELVGIKRVVNVLRIQVVAVCATVAAAVGHHVVGVVQDVDEREALIEHAFGVGPTKGPDVHLDALTALGLGTAAGKPATIEAAPNTRRVTAVQQVRHEVVVELAVGRTAVGDDELIGAHMHDGVRVEHGVRARGVVVEDVSDELASLGLADIEVIDGRTVLTSG